MRDVTHAPVSASAIWNQLNGFQDAGGNGPNAPPPPIKPEPPKSPSSPNMGNSLVTVCTGECHDSAVDVRSKWVKHGEAVSGPGRADTEAAYAALWKKCESGINTKCSSKNTDPNCSCDSGCMCSTSHTVHSPEKFGPEARGVLGIPSGATSKDGKLHVWKLVCENAEKAKCVLGAE